MVVIDKYIVCKPAWTLLFSFSSSSSPSSSSTAPVFTTCCWPELDAKVDKSSHYDAKNKSSHSVHHENGKKSFLPYPYSTLRRAISVCDSFFAKKSSSTVFNRDSKQSYPSLCNKVSQARPFRGMLQSANVYVTLSLSAQSFRVISSTCNTYSFVVN